MDSPTISREEAIRKLREDYNQEPDFSNPKFSVFDQLAVCESLPREREAQNNTNSTERTNGNLLVNGNGNGSYKHIANSESKQTKLEAIQALKTCTYRTPPKDIARLLEKVFVDCGTKDGHWLFIAQHYYPRNINWVINGMVKSHKEGWITIQNPASYFTSVIKRHYKERKSIRKAKKEGVASTNGTR